MHVEMTVNGEWVSAEVEGRLLLVHFLRDELGLTGTHWGCDTSNCGMCVVHLDGEPVKSCAVLAAMAGGHDVRTVEDLDRDGELDPVQRGFMACHGLQCGFCTPAMLMTARALLDAEPDPSEQQIREAISGTICRCTGYASIVRSVRWAAAEASDSGVSRLGAGAPRTSTTGEVGAGAPRTSTTGEVGAGAPRTSTTGEVGAGAPRTSTTGEVGAGAPPTSTTAEADA